MARRRRADSSSTQPMSTPRRRSTLRDLQASNTTADGDIITPKIIDARPSLEKAEMYGIDDPRPASSRIMALLGRIFIETIPQWLAVGAMLGLIFGGCCSNVSNSGCGGGCNCFSEGRLMFCARSLRWKLLSSELYLSYL